MKKTVELSTKRKVDIKEMSIDDIDHCNDISYTVYKNQKPSYVKNVSKAITAWIRYGVCGGGFKNYKENVDGQPDDSVLKQLTVEEKIELHNLIQEYQDLGE